MPEPAKPPRKGSSKNCSKESSEATQPAGAASPFQRAQHRTSFSMSRSNKLDSPKMNKKNLREFDGTESAKQYDVGLLRRGSVRLKRAFSQKKTVHLDAPVSGWCKFKSLFGVTKHVSTIPGHSDYLAYRTTSQLKKIESSY
ncbi:Oidioi.mRNA.OKI2018_I69.XSR.g13535.t1.cds [Oikopleura dioica]|uniref:Oidioi.mRNA.OKI2018_I69.XSR.g13535.t1.cds n=1 Tax=Oikopleura dioica TaxID=34765 RepID=A0ABN7S8V1_OIKDI|nr:Oidioi.mRNA.OKI2018_I69.XSR.g13535.t1.cds [Oikopleura dioica]